jgi:hypothetical protein
MTLIPAIAVALLGPLIGIVHSSFAGKYQLGTLYPNDAIGVVKTRIIVLIWHLPSMIWAALAFALLAARLGSGGNGLVTMLATFTYAVSGGGNLWAHRKPFVGGILLLVTAVLTVADWIINQ